MQRLKLFWKMILISIRSQMQHRASFFMLATAHFLSTFTDIFGIWVLFDRFQMLNGWTLSEVALIYGIIHMGFATAETFARGFDKFDQWIKSGDFDRLLLRPLPTLFQVAACEVQWMRIGRFLQGFLVLLWGLSSLSLLASPTAIALLLLAYVSAASLFYGLFIIHAAICFYTTEALEIMNIATFGGAETAQYPITIYKEPLKSIFTFLIPLAAVGYYPVSSLLHAEGALKFLGFLAPCAGLLFFYLSTRFWHLASRRYHSAGG